jgi:hypothetical protein
MKIILLGLGNISWQYDKDFFLKGEMTKATRTHLGAWINLGYNNFIGVDPSKEKREEFQKIFNCPAYESLDQAILHEESCEAISICSNSENHFEATLKALSLNIPFIWLEKPAALIRGELEKLIEVQKTSKSHVVVNFPRRFSSIYKKMKSTLQDQVFGEIKNIHVNYSRELKTNGVHLADLLVWILGTDCRLTKKIVFEKNNPTLCFSTQDKIEVFFIGVDVPYHNIDIVITMKKGRLSILHGGEMFLLEEEVVNNEFPQFTRLQVKEMVTDLPTGSDLIHALNSLLNKEDISSLKESLAIQQMLELFESDK